MAIISRVSKYSFVLLFCWTNAVAAASITEEEDISSHNKAETTDNSSPSLLSPLSINLLDNNTTALSDPAGDTNSVMVSPSTVSSYHNYGTTTSSSDGWASFILDNAFVISVVVTLVVSMKYFWKWHKRRTDKTNYYREIDELLAIESGDEFYL
jgi:sensor histidine kinase YesM